MKKLSILEIAKELNCEIKGNQELFIDNVVEINNDEYFYIDNKLVLLYEEKYFNLIEKSPYRCFFVSEKFDISKYIDKDYTFLISKNPKFDLIKLLNLFKLEYEFKNSKISELSYIGKNVVIKENVTIFPYVYIGDNSFIDENTIIYPNTSILHSSIIGKNVIINANCVIGSDGYGFVQDKNNNHHKIPQIGNVIIEDDVEIGSGVCIDRAMIGSTIIKKGCKIDNMVHIAHNVKIGERTLIVAQAGIAGSTKIGNDCIIAGQAGVAGHLVLGDKTIVMAKAGVTKNFESGKISGFPAREHHEELKNQVLIRKIPELLEKIKLLEDKLTNLN
ncbi:MAG: UDP-3-O-(3-hydroxymyristoyl)glucosamine N-acyltransferase [Candidatus Sericytochromatia bacterium]